MDSVIVRNIKIGEDIPKICVPIVGKTREEIIKSATDIQNTPADMVEWRVDWYEDVLRAEKIVEVITELRKILCDIPLLFTLRTKQEGGEIEITYKEYEALLLNVADTNQVDLIDIEVYKDSGVLELVSQLKQRNVLVVGSNHDFEKTPEKEEIVKRLCYMQQLGVDIPKIAVMPQSEKDVLVLLDATEEMKRKYADRPIVTMSMSGKGVLSRIAGEIFGSAITFGSVGKASAPGQLDARKLKKTLEIIHRSL